MTKPFTHHRAAALALLGINQHGFDRRTGQFLGTVAVQAEPLSAKQRDWLNVLLDRHNLPTLSGVLNNG